MTAKQKENYNRMLYALREIAAYQSSERLQNNSWDDWGLEDGSEALEMAYDNIQETAKRACKGIRVLTK